MFQSLTCMNLKRCSHFKTRRNSFYLNPSIQFSSVAQSCLTLCDPWTTALQASLSVTVSCSLLKLTFVELVMLSNHLSCHPLLLLLSIFQASGSFPVSQFFASGGQRIGVSASASVLPMNIYDWFPLGWTGWISLQSKGLKSLLQHYSSEH